jgi:hypothetical protein
MRGLLRGFEPSVPRDTIKTSRGLVSSLLDAPPNVRVGERELVPRGAVVEAVAGIMAVAAAVGELDPR